MCACRCSRVVVVGQKEARKEKFRERLKSTFVLIREEGRAWAKQLDLALYQ